MTPGPQRASCGLTHAGLVRAANEDAMLLDDRRGLWAVADGMGGHAGGAEASAEVVTCLGLVRTQWADPRALAADVIGRLENAHDAIRTRSARLGRGAAGSTVCCLTAHGAHALVIWCGDSRVYRLRPREPMRRITRDHSLVQGLVDAGRISEAEAEGHPHAHVLTRAVGATERLALDFEQLDLRRGDRFLLCSDGLTRPVEDAAIAAALAAGGGPETAGRALMDIALARGGPDNITLAVVDFE